MRNDDDPRISGEHVRRIIGVDGTVDMTLVGVVHNHPASIYRVMKIVEETDPDILALELPPLAMPLFAEYAKEHRNPPTFGGEMSAGIQMANTNRLYGIDGPTIEFVIRMCYNCYRFNVSMNTFKSVVKSLMVICHHTILCRLGAVLAANTRIRVEVDSPETYDCDWTDPALDQAKDERTQIRKSTSVLTILGGSQSMIIRDITREAYMAGRLSRLRRKGRVVAVVGIDHLDPLTERLLEI